ncbi:type II secretion system minor pseudopilin GspH [Candidatus Halobeggiatoa sp. HSG11]|nr:type II secretion system minor pseudopilin GspH [Candidatus Halobeggiatoa sp. HSG11]
MNKHKTNTGFTLIEIMVVITIISIVLGFVTLSVGDGNLAQKLEQESQRLAYLLKLASQESVMQSKEIGVHFGSDGYHFCELQTEMGICTKCETITDGVLKPRILPTGIETKIYLDGEPIFSNETCQNMPQLMILSSGEFIPFEITFTYDKLSYHLIGNMIGEITVLADESL